MPVDKFYMMNSLFSSEIKGSDVCTYFSTFIELKLSQTAMTGNVDKLIIALLL